MTFTQTKKQNQISILIKRLKVGLNLKLKVSKNVINKYLWK